ncbi:hypothetical protein [Streptomyces roseochromogenus]|uniref:Uncharacterized protein n=1 Tax=Streptomyces roseochromogenus subsp. oscitans DS 12.976 TaxID=1352936 RepID=V6JX19_STRRC|nr:hypothetical protein [Streptomyces roseochromogenus]EST24372.1 hypothetical protein M878_30630 [Streptomyces roseochromogenus subsp. oscitans DS 12.976]
MSESPDLADYEWPACLACHQDLWEDETGRYACRPCENRTHQRLTELPGLFARLHTTAQLMRGARPAGAGTSGSPTPAIPPRIDVLNLASAGGVATRLQAIEDAWRKAFGRRIEPASDGVRIFAPWRTTPGRAVAGQIEFLIINLQRACETYESIDQDIEEIRRIHAECSNALNPNQRPGRVKIGVCPVVLDDENELRCAAQLTASTSSFTVRCPNCQTTWDGNEEWKALHRAQREALLPTAGLTTAA